MQPRTLQLGHLGNHSRLHLQTRPGDFFIRALLSVLSFECVLAAFLFSGTYKEDQRFQWIDIDLLALLGVVSLLQGCLIVALRPSTIHRHGIPGWLLGTAFCGYAYLSTHWSLSQDYAEQKILRLCTINIWCLFAGGVIIARSRVRVMRLAQWITIVATWIALEVLLFYSDSLGGSVVHKVEVLAGEGGYIGLGRAVASGVVLVGARLLCTTQSGERSASTFQIAANMLVLLLLSICTLLIGARGPLISAIVALGTTFLAIHWSASSKGRLKAATVMLAGTSGIVLLTIASQSYLGDLPLALRRLLALFSTSEYYDPGTDNVRIDLLLAGLQLWREEPLFGWGLGSFSVLDGGVDSRHYCHNIIVEILCELGLVGMFLAAATFAFCLGRSRGPCCNVRRTIIAFFIYALVNSFVSGDLPDNRLVFLATGLLAYQSRTEK